jgi:hypothetical protein
MHELIEVIRAAVAEDATAEVKAAGAQACRTILAALEPEPEPPAAAQAVAGPPANPLAALAGLDIDRALDLVIARLRAALPEDKRAALGERPGMRIQLVPVPTRR